MNFSDKILVRLADPATRAGVFDATALEQIATAAYDTSRGSLAGPYSAVFDEFEIGMTVPRVATLEGHFGSLGGSERSAAHFNISGIASPVFVIDAFWRGAVIGRVSAATGRISDVDTAWPDPSAIDRDIVATLGSLPANPATLVTERRTRLVAQLQSGSADPNVVTAELVDLLIERTQSTDLNEYFDRYSRAATFGPVQVTIAPGPAPPPAAKPLPVAAAILVRDTATALAQMLADSRSVRDYLEGAGLGRVEDTGMPLRRGTLVIWVLPQTAFDDADWPGANPAARRTAAGQWLAREGIGLVVTA
jgi:hypothetical protein